MSFVVVVVVVANTRVHSRRVNRLHGSRVDTRVEVLMWGGIKSRSVFA